MGGAAISANRTAPSFRTVSVSKTMGSPRLSLLISFDVWSFAESAAADMSTTKNDVMTVRKVKNAEVVFI
jgi:hypothetical protein